MIIIGNRAHYSAIGGVENSIRGLIKVASDKKIPTTIVCRDALVGESLDPNGFELPRNIKLQTYKDDSFFSPIKRLLSMSSGGIILSKIYDRLYSKFPDAIVVARHHTHVTAAKVAGFKVVRYLVPSLIRSQLKEEAIGVRWKLRLHFLLHSIVDGYAQKKAMSNAELFVFSYSMERQVRQQMNDSKNLLPIKIVKPGIDPARFYVASEQEKFDLRCKLGLPHSKFLFLFVGRLVKAKGIDYLVSAMKDMPENCLAVLVGEGEYLPLIQEKINNDVLGHKIIYAGRSSRVEDFYQACDVFVMSSTYEPLGQTILESAACGMRIAAFSRSSGVKTATHELGIDHLIDYSSTLDGQGLARAMCKSINTTVSRNDAHAKKSATVYSWENLWEMLTIKE